MLLETFVGSSCCEAFVASTCMGEEHGAGRAACGEVARKYFKYVRERRIKMKR